MAASVRQAACLPEWILALALVEEDLGESAALAVARFLVMYVKRPGNQVQFSVPLEAQTLGTGRMGVHLHDGMTVERMAEQAAMSVRHFRRVFAGTFGTTPARFVATLRLDAVWEELPCYSVTCVRGAKGNSM